MSQCSSICTRNTMANNVVKKDTCKAGMVLTEISADNADKVKETFGITFEDINTIGQGSGLPFMMIMNDVILFPKTAAEARVDTRKFTTLAGKTAHTLVGRVWLKSLQDWDWLPLAILRRTPVKVYKKMLSSNDEIALQEQLPGVKDVDTFLREKGIVKEEVSGVMKFFSVTREEEEFFKDYPLGRELAKSDSSDIDLYRSLVGRGLQHVDTKYLHKPAFEYNQETKRVKRLENDYGIVELFKFRELKKSEL